MGPRRRGLHFSAGPRERKSLSRAQTHLGAEAKWRGGGGGWLPCPQPVARESISIPTWCPIWTPRVRGCSCENGCQ